MLPQTVIYKPKAITSGISIGGRFRISRLFPAILGVIIIISAAGQAMAKQYDPVARKAAAGRQWYGGGLGPAMEFDWFWFFYEKETAGSTKSLTVRPFYLKTGTDLKYFQASLMPILFWRYNTPEYDKWKWLFGLGQVDDVTREGKRDFDFGFFPLLFFGFGSDRAKENYLLLWPIGGTLKGKFVTSKISAYVFPGFLLFVFFPPAGILSYTTLAWGVLSLVPVYLYYEVNDFKAWNILWPFLYYGRGGRREEFRIFPFYSHFHKEGWYDKYSFLFIINYHRFYFTKDLHQTFFLFPLFGRKWSRSGRMSSVTLLWPFFSWGYDKRIGDWELNIPWPLVMFKDTERPKIRKRIFFPVYGEYRYEDSETMFITPLYIRMRKKSDTFDSQQHISFVIFWFYRRSYHGAADPYYGREWRYFKMWPLFSIEYNDRGDRAFNMFTLFPFRDRDGYEKLYQPFWSIVEYTRFRDGEKRLGLLMRLWFQRWGDRFFYCKVPFLVSVGRHGGRLTELAFFEYMFGYTVKRKGRYFRIFWIPVRIGDSEDMPPDAADEDGGSGRNIASESFLLIDRPLDSATITHHFNWK